MRLLVCGSRQWSDRSMLFATLDELHQTLGITTLIEGCASGADRFAEEWADLRSVPNQHYPVTGREWARSKGAGAMRNRRMLADGEPEYALAFSAVDPLEGGTKHMVGLLVEWNLPHRVLKQRTEVPA